MQFKEAEWESRKGTEVVANVAFGIQLTVFEYEGEWIWLMGNEDFTFKKGKSGNVFMAKIMAEHAFHQYVIENLEKCTEGESI